MEVKKNMKYKHNKRINTGLLYEMLLMTLAESIIDKDESGRDLTLSVIKRFFSSHAPLYEELNVFSAILNNKASNLKIAEDMVKETMSYSAKINTGKAALQKTKILKEIDSNFSSKFFNRRIKNYKVYASIHQLMDLYNKPKLTLEDSLKKIKLEERISKFLLENTPKKESNIKASKKYNNLVFKLVIENFNKKYQNHLTKNQKVIIKKLVESSDSDFKKFIDVVIKNTNSNIYNYRLNDVLVENKILNIKYAHLLDKWKADIKIIRQNPLKESSLTALLKYVGLLDEIKNR